MRGSIGRDPTETQAVLHAGPCVSIGSRPIAWRPPPPRPTGVGFCVLCPSAIPCASGLVVGLRFQLGERVGRLTIPHLGAATIAFVADAVLAVRRLIVAEAAAAAGLAGVGWLRLFRRRIGRPGRIAGRLPGLTISSLRLLIPPLRLVGASLSELRSPELPLPRSEVTLDELDELLSLGEIRDSPLRPVIIALSLLDPRSPDESRFRMRSPLSPLRMRSLSSDLSPEPSACFIFDLRFWSIARPS
jgi:hypothetical protein